MQPQPIPFGKYVLLEPLAKGGMAETYRARFTGPAGVTKDVVIKRILSAYAGDKSFVEMFVNEARIATTLSHGNIAQVFDFGEIDGQYFLAMELVEGQSLLQVLKRAKQVGLSQLPEPIAVLIAMRLCDALYYAHTRVAEDGRPLNIIHRDVTPENVLISYEGQVKLVDFGIAKARTAHSLTEPGMVKGKYLYLAPEQARGEPLDARTDLYAVGVVLYAMVCGRLPFEGAVAQVVHQIATEPVPAPRSVNPALAPELEQILLRALARDRQARYATAQEFSEALASFLYRDEPTFSQTRLAALMGYLFEPALAVEGRTVEVPEDFLRQLEGWKQPKAPAAPQARRSGARSQPEPTRPLPEPDIITTTVREARPAGSRVEPDGSEAPRAPSSGRRLGWAVLLGALFVGALLGSLALLQRWKEGSAAVVQVRVRSTPPGAWVELDGHRLIEVTPLTVSSVSIEKHRLAILREGAKPWSTEFTPKLPGPFVVEAKLEPVEAPPAPPAPPSGPAAADTGEAEKAGDGEKAGEAAEAGDAAKPGAEGASPEAVKPAAAEPAGASAGAKEPGDAVAPAVAFKVVKHRPTAEDAEPPGEAMYPAPSFKVVASRHRLSVADDPHVSTVELDPTERYRLWTEGSLKLAQDESRSTRSVLFVAKGADGAPDVTGIASPRPVVIEHASALYAMVVDPRWDNNQGTVTVRLQGLTRSRKLRLAVDAKKNALDVPARHRFLLSGLDPRLRYELAIRPVVVSAEERPGRLVCASLLRDQENLDAVTDGLQVLEPGGSYKVSGADAVACSFLDAGGTGARGELQVEVRAGSSAPDPDQVEVLRHTRGGR